MRFLIALPDLAVRTSFYFFQGDVLLPLLCDNEIPAMNDTRTRKSMHSSPNSKPSVIWEYTHMEHEIDCNAILLYMDSTNTFAVDKWSFAWSCSSHKLLLLLLFLFFSFKEMFVSLNIPRSNLSWDYSTCLQSQLALAF